MIVEEDHEGVARAGGDEAVGDRVAQGIVDAYRSIGEIPVPIIVRLQGTNAAEAKKLIEDSGLKVYSAIMLQEAADLVRQHVG